MIPLRDLIERIKDETLLKPHLLDRYVATGTTLMKGYLEEGKIGYDLVVRIR